MTPREHLREEHGTIMKVLARFRNMLPDGKDPAIDPEANPTIDPQVGRNNKPVGWMQVLENILDFLEIYVDRSHHGKEEEILFPALEALNIAGITNLTADLCRDHHSGHALLEDLKSEFRHMKKTGVFPTTGFIETAGKCIDLLRAHIRKENARLLPELDRLSTDGKHTDISHALERYERNVPGLARVSRVPVIFR